MTVVTEPPEPVATTPEAPHRSRWARAWSRYTATSPTIVTVFAVILGLIVGAFVIIFTSAPILDAWRQIFSSGDGIGHALNVTFDNVGAAYRSMFTGSVLDPQQFWHSIVTGKGWDTSLTPLSETFTYATPLVIASIGVALSFQTGLFNIGANGQAVLGGILGVAAGSMLSMPTFWHFFVTMGAGIAGGAVGGLLPGVLKAYTGAHEVIVTLMENYICAALLIYVVLSTALQQPGQSADVSRTLDPSAQLAPLFGDGSGLRVSYGVFVAAAVVIFAWWFLDRSSLGFDFRVTGANPNAARAAGINAKRVIVLVFLMSGGLAGLAGIVQVASTTHFVDGGFLVGDAGIGFTAITVALLGRNRPMGIVWGSLLFAALDVGGRAMEAATSIPLDLATVIQSIIVLFVATPVLVKEIFRLRNARTASLQFAVKGWGS
jgi:ABC-type uncharacterized transport system permease subunit